jgi:hypothetical protein
VLYSDLGLSIVVSGKVCTGLKAAPSLARKIGAGGGLGRWLGSIQKESRWKLSLLVEETSIAWIEPTASSVTDDAYFELFFEFVKRECRGIRKQ